MFGINANLKKSVAIAAIALTSVLGASNASAQQEWMEEVLEKQLQEQEAARQDQAKGSREAETTDSGAGEKADSNAS